MVYNLVNEVEGKLWCRFVVNGNYVVKFEIDGN